MFVQYLRKMYKIIVHGKKEDKLLNSKAWKPHWDVIRKLTIATSSASGSLLISKFYQKVLFIEVTGWVSKDNTEACPQLAPLVLFCNSSSTTTTFFQAGKIITALSFMMHRFLKQETFLFSSSSLLDWWMSSLASLQSTEIMQHKVRSCCLFQHRPSPCRNRLANRPPRCQAVQPWPAVCAFYCCHIQTSHAREGACRHPMCMMVHGERKGVEWGARSHGKK